MFWVNYLGGNMRDLALNFSRPGGQVVCQYYNFLRLGREGYRKIHTACYETARYLAAEIEKLGPFEIIYGGQMDAGIPALCWKIREGVDPGFTLYDLADRLRSRGWQVPAYSLPANRQDLVIQRILVRHGVSRDLGSLLPQRYAEGYRALPATPDSEEHDGEGGFRLLPLTLGHRWSSVSESGWPQPAITLLCSAADRCISAPPATRERRPSRSPASASAPAGCAG